ncbi:hypothetical protein M413DRAFT_31224 [Hebeloma cylindrosporum]|uniref:Uncharacterized protein n=1 Tax=Hebeloma cylindrosporum TaxID=76867 RepID=A0A0C3BYF7_HEBCY|nr:hypothetical protein M413DRAFT_31224 [Hebeloma cylindrosporum h7]
MTLEVVGVAEQIRSRPTTCWAYRIVVVVHIKPLNVLDDSSPRNYGSSKPPRYVYFSQFTV